MARLTNVPYLFCNKIVVNPSPLTLKYELYIAVPVDNNKNIKLKAPAGPQGSSYVVELDFDNAPTIVADLATLGLIVENLPSSVNKIEVRFFPSSKLTILELEDITEHTGLVNPPLAQQYTINCPYAALGNPSTAKNELHPNYLIITHGLKEKYEHADELYQEAKNFTTSVELIADGTVVNKIEYPSLINDSKRFYEEPVALGLERTGAFTVAIKIATSPIPERKIKIKNRNAQPYPSPAVSSKKRSKK